MKNDFIAIDDDGKEILVNEQQAEYLKSKGYEVYKNPFQANSSSSAARPAKKRPLSSSSALPESSSSFMQNQEDNPLFNPQSTYATPIQEKGNYNPVQTALSLALPLTVDEIAANGLSRPGVLGAKTLGDAAMFAVPATKVVAGGARLGVPLLKNSTRLANWGEKAYLSGKAGDRMLGQGVNNAIDNAVYGTAQNMLDNQEHNIGDYLGTAGIGAGLGFGTGAIGGMRSYGNTVDFRTDTYKAVKAKQNSRKQDVFDQNAALNPDVADAADNTSQAVQLISKQPMERFGPIPVPPTWEQIGARYERDIAAKKAEIARRAERESSIIDEAIEWNGGDVNNLQHWDFVPEGIDRRSVEIVNQSINPTPLRVPVFANENERIKFFRSIDDFLRQNEFGQVIADEAGNPFLRLDAHVSDVEEAFMKMHKPDLKAKGIKDWQGALRQTLRDARIGAGIESGSYAEAMKDLANLHTEKQILDWAAGGRGFQTQPSRFGVLSSFNSKTRPQIGLADIDLDIASRNITQAGQQIYKDWDELSEWVGRMLAAEQEHGENSPEANAVYKEMPIEAKNAYIQATQDRLEQWLQNQNLPNSIR